MQQTLFPARNLVFKKVKNFYMILNPDAPNLMVINRIGKELIQLFDGILTVSGVLNCLRYEYKLNEEEIHKLESFISSLVDAGFLCTKPPGSLKEAGLGLQRLTKLFLHLTNECNLRCIHCHRSSGLQMKNEMLKNDFVRVVREFADLDGTTLVITGGEPLLKKETLYEVTREARNGGIKEIVITSNGTIISNRDIRLLNKYDAKVAVSLDGATASIHDNIRGRGTFGSTTKNIIKLVKAGVDTSIETTLMKLNMNEAEQIIYTARNLGVGTVAFSFVMIKGRAEKNRQLLALNNKDILSVSEVIRETSERAKVKTNIESFWLKSKRVEKRIMCGAGITMLSIGANGDVYPCQSLHEEFLKSGNVQGQNLKKIWNNSGVLEKFRKMSVLDIEGCRNCDLKFICAGGCRADGYNAYGNLHGRTPFCSVYRTMYWTQLVELAQELWEKA